MIDYNAHLSSELRHLAFRKSTEQATWQEAIKQQRLADIEDRLGIFTHYNFLANLFRTLFTKRQWRRAHRPSPGLMTNAPSRHKAG